MYDRYERLKREKNITPRKITEVATRNNVATAPDLPAVDDIPTPPSTVLTEDVPAPRRRGRRRREEIESTEVSNSEEDA